MQRPVNFAGNRRLCRCFRRVGALARGASLKISAPMMTLSLSSAGGRAGAWSVLENLGANDDPLAVFGGWARWRVERP